MLNQNQIEHIAKLARLSLTEEEKKLFAAQISNIVESFEALAKIDTANVEPLYHPLTLTDVVREDEVCNCDVFEKFAQNIPERQDNFVKVPKI